LYLAKTSMPKSAVALAIFKVNGNGE
jgi:hypothetical protein